MRLILLILLSAFSFQHLAFSQAYMANRREAFQPATSVSYLKTENFEDATTGYDSSNANGWTTNIGTAINPKATPALDGSQSLTLAMSAKQHLRMPIGSQGEIYFFKRFKPVASTYTGGAYIFQYDVTGSGIANYRLKMTASAHTFGLLTNNNTAAGSCVGLTNNTLYYLWGHYKSGPSGIAEFWWSLDSTKPSSPQISAPIGLDTKIDGLGVGNDSGDGDLVYWFDDFRISTNNIGSNPP
jgi:hypothetical protein